MGGGPTALPPSEVAGTSPLLWAWAESQLLGGVAVFSELNLLRKSRYRSRPLAVTGISFQSLSNCEEAEGRPRVSADHWEPRPGRQPSWGWGSSSIKNLENRFSLHSLGGSVQKPEQARTRGCSWL